MEIDMIKTKNQTGKKVFRSRFSVLLIGFIVVLLLPAAIPTFAHKAYTGIFILGGVFLFILLFYSGIHYVISDDKLYFKIWIITTCSLKITDIAAMKRSYYIFDRPTNTTASFKKLRIQFVRGARYSFSYIHVSPIREQEFIEEFKKINPDISVSLYDKKGIGRIWDWYI